MTHLTSEGEEGGGGEGEEAPGEDGGHDGALAVEDVLRRILLEPGVPHQTHAVRLVRCVLGRQAAPGCTMLHQAAPGCTRLHQSTPCYTSLHQAAPV